MTTKSFGRLRVVTAKDMADDAAKNHNRERRFMDMIVHVPVAVAIGISIYGYQQYGWFLAGLAPLTIYVSVTLSHSLQRIITTRRLRPDVCISAAVSALGCFLIEAYGVHLGLERFNHLNEASGLMVMDDTALIVFSVLLGLKNFYNRRAFVTGLDTVTDVEWSIEQGRNKSSLRKKEDSAKNENWLGHTVQSERRERFGQQDAGKLRGRGVAITPEDYLTAAKLQDEKGNKEAARILRGMAGEKIAPEAKAS